MPFTKRMGRGIAATLAVLVSYATQAVELNPAGIGDVLLFPFYTVDDPGTGGFVTLLSLTNQSEHIKAARVRFRDGREGRSALEFNLYLRPRDSWVAAILPDEVGASIATPDRSCTYPAISMNEAVPTPLGKDPISGAEPFPRDQARTGYVEVFELGDYGPGVDAPIGSVAAAVMLAPGGATYGAPVDCARTVDDDGKEATRAAGSLTGYVTQISVYAGVELSQAPTALANFNTERTLFARPETGQPTLADVSPRISVIHDPGWGTIRTQWTMPIDAVTAILMRSAVSGDVVLDRATASQTSWVLTMPTRAQYVALGQPARSPFSAPPNVNSACEIVRNELDGWYFDRDGRKATRSDAFMPPRPDRAICWASTVVNFEPQVSYSPEKLLYARYPYQATANQLSPYPVSPQNVAAKWENGWMRIPLHTDSSANVPIYFAHEMTGGPTTILHPDGTVETRPQLTFQGLPVIGFFASTYRNGTLGDGLGHTVLSNYSSSLPLRYEVSVR